MPSRRPSRPSSRQALSARLVARSGPAAGEEFALEGDELVIGRAVENAVSIADTSVSRKHALVRKTEAGWAVSDLGSGNGTAVNGEAIDDETLLNSGDLITLGDTELLFELERAERPAQRPPVRTARTRGDEDEGTVARGRPVRSSRRGQDAQEKASKRKKTIKLASGILALFVVLLLGWKIVDSRKQNQREKAQQVLRQHEGSMAEMLKEAKALVRQGKWAEAKEKLEEVQDEDPTYEPVQVENYLLRAEEELPNEALFASAYEAIARGELSRAAQILSTVKTTSQEAVLQAARDSLDAKASEKLAQARSMLGPSSDSGVLVQVKALCDEVLSVRSDDRDALELKAQIEAALARTKGPSGNRVAGTPATEVMARVENGDIAGAISSASACASRHPQCATLMRELKDYDAKSKRIEDLNESETLSVYQLGKKLGVSGAASLAVRSRLATKLFASANQAKAAHNWPQAILSAHRVLEMDPSHMGAQALINEGRNQARETYLHGYTLKDSNPEEAIRRFREVLTLAPPDDESYRKAKARLAELQGQ